MISRLFFPAFLTRAALAVFMLLTLPALPALADDRMDRLFDALQVDDVMQVMAEEGDAYAAVIASDLFPEGGGAQWERDVARIYDVARMRALMENGFGAGLSDATYDRVLQFYESDLGRRVTELELSARRALLDKEVEAAAIEAYEAMVQAENPVLDPLRRYVEANDLVDENVVGGLNSNVAFYRGLVDGGAFPFEMTDEQILADVWGQEAEIREETIEWIYSYLAMAYHPLSEDEMRAYIELSVSKEGQAFNAALFAAFDVMFNDISYQLGRAAGQIMSGQDI